VLFCRCRTGRNRATGGAGVTGSPIPCGTVDVYPIGTGHRATCSRCVRGVEGIPPRGLVSCGHRMTSAWGSTVRGVVRP
jgi:hypothetical protein